MSIFKSLFSGKKEQESKNELKPAELSNDEGGNGLEDDLTADTDTDEEAVETFICEPLDETSDISAEESGATPESEAPKSVFGKFFDGLQKTRKNLLDSVEGVLSAFVVIDEDLFEQLEEALIMADIGVETSVAIMNSVRSRVKRERVSEVTALKTLVADEISKLLKSEDSFVLKTPAVLLIIGVNGVGKTTAIGKLANKYKSEGKSVILAAADTFRAAAIDQLDIWAGRNNVPIIKHQENSDPAAVVYDAVQAAKKRNVDVLICDTAGRLHNKKNLMEELRKIDKIITKEYGEANKEVFLVLDATTGQNALQQAKIFSETADITGIILTKLDGTAKGGIVIAIKNELNIPVRYIGVGEKITDIEPFDAEAFSRALFIEEE